MERLSRKLHSSCGASMLLGLLYLLVCLTVGAVVLTAAATNAGRIERNRLDQQDYLAVASAVTLAKADMDGAKFVGEYQQIITEWDELILDGVDDAGNKIYHRKHHSETEYKKGPGTGMDGCDLLECTKDDFVSLYYSTIQVPEIHEAPPTSMTYGLAVTADSEGFPQVKGTMKVSMTDDVNAGLRQYAVLDVLSAKTEDADSNATTLKFTPQIKATQSTDVTVDDIYTITTTTYTTTVTWNAPVVSKGAAK